MANNLTHDALRIPIRGAKFNVRIPFDNEDDAAESFDTEISKDNGAFADCTNELEVVGGGTSCDMGYLTLTAAEMTANSVVLKLDAVSGVQPTLVAFEPANLPALYSGTAEAGSTTMLQLIVSNYPDFDHALVGCIVRNNTTGEAREVKTYLGSTRQITFDAMETAVAAGHTYDILLADEAALDYWAAVLTMSAADQAVSILDTRMPDIISLANIDTQVDTALANAGVNVTAMGRLDVAVSTRLATAGYTAPLDAAGTRGAVGLATANLDTQLAAIVGDTNELQTDWVNGGRLDNILDARASQGSVDTVAGYLDTEVAAILAAVDTEVAAIKAKTDNLPASPAATGDIPSAATIVAAVFAQLIESGLTFEQVIRLAAAVWLGKTTGAGTDTERFKSAGGNTDRVVATYDAQNNRATVTLTP